MKNYFYDLPEDIQHKIFLQARSALLALVHIELWVAVRYHTYDPEFRSAGGIEFMEYCKEVDSGGYWLNSDDQWSECDGKCCGGREENYKRYFG
jgi:hypothetical protein